MLRVRAWNRLPAPPHVREPNCFTLDFYLQHEGYEGLKKALAMTPDQVVEMVKASGLRGRGGAGFPTGMKWQFVDKKSPKPQVHRLQRRRKRAGDVQGPPADGAQSAPADRGVRDCLLRDRREGRLHLHPRRVLPRPARARARDRRGLRARVPRQEHPRVRASTATSTCTAAPARTKPARRPRCSSRSKASAPSRATSRRFRRSSASTTVRPP